jgi:ABC-type phosphate transport system substrate-binding protein
MSMKRSLLAVAAAFLLAPAGPGAAADDVAVIVNKANAVSNLTMAELRKIVLAQEAEWSGGGKILVWMPPPGRPERARTLKLVCGMTETDFTLHFMHASFNADSGDPPRIGASPEQVRHSIATTVNGVGFISASQVDDTVKVVSIDGIRPGQPAYKITLK